MGDRSLHGEERDVVDEFKYVGVEFSKDGRGKLKLEVEPCLGEKLWVP